MDLKQLEYFVKVAELGSFTKAANALQIAQPALSRQIRLLEVELRQNLLLRNGRGAITTEAGALLLQHGKGILHQLARAKEELGRNLGGLSGRVAVGMPPSIARLLALPMVREFHKKMPTATIAISEGLSASLHAGLTSGRLDIALLYNMNPSPEIELQALFSEPMYALRASKGAASQHDTQADVSLHDLAQMPLIIPTRPNSFRLLVETQLAALSLKPTIALEIDGVASILELVADGAGCAVLPHSAVLSNPSDGRFSVQRIVNLESRLTLATSAQRPTTLTQRAMQEMISGMAKTLILDHQNL